MLKVRKIPMRSCVVTKEKFPKTELLRIVRTPEDTILVDLKGKVNGRGAYIKKDIVVLEKAIKTKALERHLEIPIPLNIYEEIKEIINN